MATEAAQLKGKEPTEVKTVLTLTGLLMEGVVSFQCVVRVEFFKPC